MARSDNYSVKREIIDAVIRIMSEKNYMDITVTDIVNKAGVARASFYRNFNSINDVIEAIADEMSEELIGDIFPTLYGADERKWREFLFDFFYRFTRRQKEIGNIRFENMSVLFSRMDNIMQQKDAQLPSKTIRDKYLPVSIMGLLNNIAKRWVDSGMKETPEEMINYIMSFITLL